MEIPHPNEADLNRGTSVVIAGWVLTGIVAVVLLFRAAVKLWISLALSPTARPRRIWGLEDLFLSLGFIIDVAHMYTIGRSYQAGLGRHFFYLTAGERTHAMRWDWISAPIAVTAVSLSRTGVMCFLYACFAKSKKRLAISLLVCIGFHAAVNLVTILQSILQCGPNPPRAVNRAAYYKYMWEPLPEDGSVICQSPHVQEYIGYGQGAFNALVDFTLVGLAAFEIWQFLFRAHAQHLTQWMDKFKAIEPHVRRQRLWQTFLVSAPLSLSGVACIIKSPLVGAIGERMDITWNLIPLILWVKIENYAIPLAATATVLRLFIKVFVTKGSHRGTHYGYASSRNARPTANAVELAMHPESQWEAESEYGKQKTKVDSSEDVENPSMHGSEIDLVDHDGIYVKYEYEVRAESQEVQGSAESRSNVSGGPGQPMSI